MENVVGSALLEALGGQSNIVDIDVYRMRLRVHVRSQHNVNEDALRIDPVLAVVRTKDCVQIVTGTRAHEIGTFIRESVQTAKVIPS